LKSEEAALPSLSHHIFRMTFFHPTAGRFNRLSSRMSFSMTGRPYPLVGPGLPLKREMIMKWKQLFTPAENLEASDLEAFVAQQPEGSYTLLDVRQPAEYEQSHIPGSLLIPLPELTDRIHELDPGKPTIVY
jgi:hypothetical protein